MDAQSKNNSKNAVITADYLILPLNMPPQNNYSRGFPVISSRFHHAINTIMIKVEAIMLL